MGSILTYSFGRKLLTIYVFLIFITTLSFTQSVQIITTQKGIPYLDEKIFSQSNSLMVQILNVDIHSEKRYRFVLEIKGNGIDISSDPDFFPRPIEIRGVPVRLLTSADLAEYFEIDNLVFSGYSKEEYLNNGGLPDGMYNICFKLYDITADAFFLTGAPSCATFWMKREDPPKIVQPVRNPVISETSPFYINWIPRHTMATFVQYQLEVYENDPDMSIQDIIVYQSPVIKENLNDVNYILSPHQVRLKSGREYFVIIKAFSPGTIFKNGGYSEPEYFTYGTNTVRFSQPAVSNECRTYWVCWEDIICTGNFTRLNITIDGVDHDIVFQPPVQTAGGYDELVAQILENLALLGYTGGFSQNIPALEDCLKGNASVPGLFFTNSNIEFNYIRCVFYNDAVQDTPFNYTDSYPCDGCIDGAPCDDGNACTTNDKMNSSCECIGTPVYNVNFGHLDDQLCIVSDCQISSMVWDFIPEPTGSLFLNNDPTNQCVFFDPSICYKATVTCSDGCIFSMDYGSGCDCIEGTLCDDGDDCTSFDIINENCACEGTPTNITYIEIAGDILVAQTKCENATYLWNTGETTRFTNNFDPELCYRVTVTCGNNCQMVAVFGEDCFCEPGRPCPGDDPCFYYGLFDENCDCPEPVLIPDNNGNGICDDVLPCLPGSPCNDGNICTINDVINVDCNCEGVSDNTVVIEQDDLQHLSAEINCSDPKTYLWNTGETTQNIFIGEAEANACFDVTVTCGNGCSYTNKTGDCSCIAGTPCPGEIPCMFYGFYSNTCECPDPVPLTDSDEDGICDEMDQCPGMPDIDFDQDGIVDCLDDNIPCDNLEVTSNFVTIRPGVCDYAINLDKILGQNEYVLFEDLIVNDGVEEHNILANIPPICYGDQPSGSFEVAHDDFETDLGFWSGIGNYVKRVENFSHPDGQYSLQIKGSDYFSKITSESFSVQGMSSIRISFSYLAKSFEMENFNEKIVLEISYDYGQTYQVIREWYNGLDFFNNQRQSVAVLTTLNDKTSVKYRISRIGGGNSTRLYLDDVRILKSQSACDKINSANTLVQRIQNWLTQHSYSGIVSVGDEQNVEPDKHLTDCIGNGKILRISGSNINFKTLEFSGPAGNGVQSFCGNACDELISPFPLYIAEITSVNCSNPTYLWNDGSNQSSIQVLSPDVILNVTVTCENGCQEVVTFNEGNGACVLGAPCPPSEPCFQSGTYDSNCNCVSSDPKPDVDEDGICDDEDPCPDTSDHSDNNNNGVPDCVECKNRVRLQYIADPAFDVEVYDLCTSIGDLLRSQVLENVVVYTNSGSVNLSEQDGFEFPYCNETLNSYCEYGEPFTPEFYTRPSLKKFAIDFYQWAQNENKNIYTKFTTEECNGVFSFFIHGFKHNKIDLFFSNGVVRTSVVKEKRTVKDNKFRIQPRPGDLDPDCSSFSYVWSNGATSTFIIVDNQNVGASVTITCNDTGYACISTTNGKDCIIGTPCNDYDPCTVNDVYNGSCLCIGEPAPDSDLDGVPDPCDKCPGHNDNLDTDRDGIPDGCDTCEIPTTRTCRYCVQLNDCIRINGYRYIDGAGTSHDIEFDFVYVCWETPSTLADLKNALVASFAQNGISATVDIENSRCGGSFGWSITIITVNSDIKFESFSVLNTSSNQYIFQEECQTQQFPEPCDDGNPCTINDVEDENCNCRGTCVDVDQDGVCEGTEPGAPCDVCHGSPDNIDINQNGIPDGCDIESHFYCDGTALKFCDYIKLRAQCDKLETVDMREVQKELIEHFTTTGWNPGNFYVWELLDQLQDPGNPEFDEDGDGLIDFLDPCYDEPNPGIFTYEVIHEYCREGEEFGTPLRDVMLANWLYTPIDYFKNGAPPPCNGHDNMFLEEAEDNEGNKYLVFAAGSENNNAGAEAKITVTCCECKIECLHDIDGDGICDENDDNIVICDDPPCAECVEDVACPDPEDACHYYRIENCECVEYPRPDGTGALPDADGDGICDLLDVCEGVKDEDTDEDGIMDCVDPCFGAIDGHHENPEILPPTGPGDPCDDGNPCTYGDRVVSVDNVCTCEGTLVDLDFDGITDCEECKIYFLGSNGNDPPVEVSIQGPFENCNACYVLARNESLETRCDLCPGLSDDADYNGNGVPDCLDPKFYDVSCPEDFVIVPGVGLVLIFDADKILLEDIPNPIKVYGVSSSPGQRIYTNDFAAYSHTREVDGTYEVLYPFEDLTPPLSSLLVQYSGSQPCPLISNDEPLVDIICPTMTLDGGDLFMSFDYPPGMTPDLFTFAGAFSFGTADNNTITHEVPLSSIILKSSSQGGVGYSVFIADVGFGVSPVSVTLPNGIVCTYINNEIVKPCAENTLAPGAPCDCDPTVWDCLCFTHFRLDNNCQCVGEPKPDSDNDGICDEFDKCDQAVNACELDGDGNPIVDADGDGYCDCPCEALVLTVPQDETTTNPTLVNGNDVSIDLNMPDPSLYAGFTVTITGGPDMAPIVLPVSNPLVIPNLPKGYSYVITVTAQCATGGTSNVDVEVEDVPFESNPLFCGINLKPVNLSTLALLPALSQGDVIRASDFDVTIREAKGSYGKFTGKGYIKIPYFEQVRINVNFKDITLSVDKQLIQGYINVNGFGLAVLGDPFSDIINEGLNDIINTLEDISDILDVLGDVLEVVEELYATTKDLVSEESKTCLARLTLELKTLKEQAEQNPNDPDLKELIKIKTVELKNCQDKYDAELAIIMGNLLKVVEFTLPKLFTQYCTSPLYNDVANPNSFESLYLAKKEELASFTNAQNVDALSRLSAQISEIENQGFVISKVKTVNGDNENYVPDPIGNTLTDDFYEYENNWHYCYNLDLMVNSSEKIQTPAAVTQLIQMFLHIGDAVAPAITDLLKQGQTPEQISNDTSIQDLFKNYLRKSIQNKDYGNFKD